ncbi:MAG: NADH-quinone oxidoreductase subunit J [Pseudomonadota bacterium]
MSFEKFIFYVFSLVLIFAATMVITRRNPVHSVLFLVLAFFNAAGLWLLLEAEFLALVLVLVYVGAVMVLFLFVVMMLDVDVAEMRAGFIKNLPLGLLIGAAMIIEILMVVGPKYFGLEKFAAPAKHAADYSNTEALGGLLYSDYLYPFEIAAVILLVAIIAAISLTLRRRPDRKYIETTRQLAATKAKRLRVVKMEAEK